MQIPYLLLIPNIEFNIIRLGLVVHSVLLSKIYKHQLAFSFILCGVLILSAINDQTSSLAKILFKYANFLIVFNFSIYFLSAQPKWNDVRKDQLTGILLLSIFFVIVYNTQILSEILRNVSIQSEVERYRGVLFNIPLLIVLYRVESEKNYYMFLIAFTICLFIFTGTRSLTINFVFVSIIIRYCDAKWVFLALILKSALYYLLLFLHLPIPIGSIIVRSLTFNYIIDNLNILGNGVGIIEPGWFFRSADVGIFGAAFELGALPVLVKVLAFVYLFIKWKKNIDSFSLYLSYTCMMGYTMSIDFVYLCATFLVYRWLLRH